MDQYDIVVSVRGSQVHEAQENTMELLTEGRLLKDKGKYIIEYDENYTGLEGAHTRLTVDGGDVWIKRTGVLETEFLFMDKKQYEASYKTPYGRIQLLLLPTQVKSELSEEQGQIDLEYIIKIGGQSALNRLNINYKLKN